MNIFYSGARSAAVVAEYTRQTAGGQNIKHTIGERRSGEGPPFRLPRHAPVKRVTEGNREEHSGGAENDADDGVLKPLRHGGLLSLTLIVRAYLEKSKCVSYSDAVGLIV